MTPTPELALTAALVALFGVLVNALVTAYNARKRGNLDERLLTLKAELDQINAREMARMQAENAERLKNLEFSRVQDAVGDERKRKADSERFAAILESLNPQGVIALLRDHDFGGSFDREDIAPLHSFANLCGDPDQTFLFADLEHLRLRLAQQARALSKLIGLKTYPRLGTQYSVLPPEQVNKIRPDWVTKNATEINLAATEFVSVFDEFVLQCRKKLGG